MGEHPSKRNLAAVFIRQLSLLRDMPPHGSSVLIPIRTCQRLIEFLQRVSREEREDNEI